MNGLRIPAFSTGDKEITKVRGGFRADVAEEGQLTWVCGYGLGAAGQNLDAAYAPLNQQTGPEVQALFAETYTYLVSNQDTLRLLSDRLVRKVGLDHPEERQKAIPLRTPDNYDAWLRVWREVKAA